MKNPFQTAPRCVQWAAVLLAAVPVFDTLVALKVMTLAQWLSQWQLRFPNFAVHLGIAAGLLYGINIVRLFFVALVLFNTGTEFFSWYERGFYSMSLVATLTPILLPWFSVVLSVLPAANRYFAGKHEPSSASEKEPVGKAIPPVAGIGLVLLLLIGSIFVLPHFRLLLENASFMTSEREAAQARITQQTADIAIINNLRMLDSAGSQYFMERPGTDTAAYSDLVGSGKLITMLVPGAGEKYPDQFHRGIGPVAVMPDGVVVAYDSATGQITKEKPHPLAQKK